MAIEKNKYLSLHDTSHIESPAGLKIGIVVAEWNPQITNSLLEGTLSELKKLGVVDEDIFTIHVPGSFELPQGASLLLKKKKLDAVICLGCVIQGETRHFEFICQAVSQGITNLSIQERKPVIFGVLTTENMEQATERSGGKHGNKGHEAAVTAVKMALLRKTLKEESKGKKE